MERINYAIKYSLDLKKGQCYDKFFDLLAKGIYLINFFHKLFKLHQFLAFQATARILKEIGNWI